MANRRNIFLINRRFQLKFSFYVCSWLFALSIVYPFIIYNLFEFLVSFAYQHKISGAANALEGIRMGVIWRLVLLHGLFMGVTFLISLFMSHKIAGPLYKLQRFFEEAKTGKLNPQLTFRKADHFPELAEDFNEMIGGIKRKVDRNVDQVAVSIANLESCQSHVGPEGKENFEKALTKLREVHEQLSN